MSSLSSLAVARAKFGASEVRLNLLEPSLPLEYPLNVYSDTLDGRQEAEYERVSSLAGAGQWAELRLYLEDHPHLINTARLRARPGAEAEAGDSEDNKTFLWTPLHWAASLDTAGLDVILMLLNFGALKSLRTGLGETAHEIAVRRGRAADIVRTLEEPRAVRDNRRAIGNIEAAVHRLMLARVGDKLRATGAQLPQLAVLWEMSNECGESVLYPVYGMRGGFSLDLDHEDNSLTMVGWSRAEAGGGGEVRHTIDSEGGVTEVTDRAEARLLDTLAECAD